MKPATAILIMSALFLLIIFIQLAAKDNAAEIKKKYESQINYLDSMCIMQNATIDTMLTNYYLVNKKDFKTLKIICNTEK